MSEDEGGLGCLLPLLLLLLIPAAGGGGYWFGMQKAHQYEMRALKATADATQSNQEMLATKKILLELQLRFQEMDKQRMSEIRGLADEMQKANTMIMDERKRFDEERTQAKRSLTQQKRATEAAQAECARLKEKIEDLKKQLAADENK